jgi:GxxExxY protein
MEEVNSLTEKIIGCAIEVHRELGPGLLESVYEEALCVEFQDTGLKFQRQLTIPALYKGRQVGEYRIDLIVEDAVIIELKSVDRHDPVFEAQILTYLKVTGKKVGLLINFNSKSNHTRLRQRISTATGRERLVATSRSLPVAVLTQCRVARFRLLKSGIKRFSLNLSFLCVSVPLWLKNLA